MSGRYVVEKVEKSRDYTSEGFATALTFGLFDFDTTEYEVTVRDSYTGESATGKGGTEEAATEDAINNL